MLKHHPRLSLGNELTEKETIIFDYNQNKKAPTIDGAFFIVREAGKIFIK